MKLKEFVGWLGVLCILTAFILTTVDVIEPKHLAYGILNLLGALGIIVSSYFKRDFPPVFLNIVWLIVALFGTLRSLDVF